ANAKPPAASSKAPPPKAGKQPSAPSPSPTPTESPAGSDPPTTSYLHRQVDRLEPAGEGPPGPGAGSATGRERQAGQAPRDRRAGDRSAGKALRSLGGPRGRGSDDRSERERSEAAALMEATADELTPLIGRKRACAAVGLSRAGWYRRHRQSPPPARPAPAPKRPHPRALSQAERDVLHAVLHEPRF